MILLLTVLTALAVLAIVAVIVFYLVGIIAILEADRWYAHDSPFEDPVCRRAIEEETSALGPDVTQPNEALTAIADGLRWVDDHLASTVAAVAREGSRR